jgi:glutamate 5-kinase
MNILSDSKRLIFKIGTSTLTHPTGRLDLRRMEMLARVLSDLKNSGKEIILVSSGAMSAGAARLAVELRLRDTTDRPALAADEKQALAAVGQTELMKLWERFFTAYGHTVGQILMTRDVVDDPHRLSLVRATFSRLLAFGCVPVVNENDSVSSEEIKFGGNDTLSAYVGIVCGADLIVNMTDIDGLYDSDPRVNPNAKLIDRVDEITDEVRAWAGGAGTDRGTGGMAAKVRAAGIAADAGIPTLIINGSDPAVIYDIMECKHVGTYFAAKRATSGQAG